MRIPACVIAITALAACAANPSPVPVEAGAADLRGLEGRWEVSRKQAADHDR